MFSISVITNCSSPVGIVFVAKIIFKSRYPDMITNLEFYFTFLFDCLKSVRRTKFSFDLFTSDGVIPVDLCLSLKLYSSHKFGKISVHFLLFLASNCVFVLLFKVRLNLSILADFLDYVYGTF